jgi:hypothetical protein
VIRRPLSRILSLALASLSFTGHLVQGAHAQVVLEQHEILPNCFVGADFAGMSLGELTLLVNQSVADLRARGWSDMQIVESLGVQLAQAASNCSPAQAAGVVRNVTLILGDLGFQIPNRQLYLVLYTSFEQDPGALLEPDVVTRTASVY